MLVASAAIWGSTFPLMKLVNSYVDSIPFIALRMTVAAIALGIVIHKRLKGITAKMFFSCATFGIILAVHSFLQVQGLRYTTASNSGFISSSNVVFVPLLMFLLYRKRPSRNTLLGLFAVVIGFTFISGIVSLNPFSFNVSALNIGDLLTLICAVFVAVYFILGNNLVARYDPILVNFIHLIFAAISAFILWPLSPEKTINLANGVVICVILYCGIFGSAIAFLLMLRGQQRIEPTRASMTLSLEPIFALSFALIIPDWNGNVERLALHSVLGGFLVVLGVIICSLPTARAE